MACSVNRKNVENSLIEEVLNLKDNGWSNDEINNYFFENIIQEDEKSGTIVKPSFSLISKYLKIGGLTEKEIFNELPEFKNIGSYQEYKNYKKDNDHVESWSNIDLEYFTIKQNNQQIFDGNKEEYFPTDIVDSSYILNKIVSIGSNLSVIARELQNFTQGFSIPVEISRKIDKYFSGFYHHDNHTISLSGYNGIDFERVFLHEYIHGFTVHFIKDNQEHPYVKELSRILEFIKSQNIEKSKRKNEFIEEAHYALTNEFELVTEFFTNAEFIKALQKLPPANKFGNYSNLLEELFNWIINIFNVKEESLYTEIFPFMTSILKEGITYENAREKQKNYQESLNNTISAFPSEFSNQGIENFEHLKDVSDQINSTNPNIITEVVNDWENQDKVRIQAFMPELVPSGLKKPMVNKSFTASQVGKITLNNLLTRLSKSFPSLNFEFIDQTDLNQNEHLVPIHNINSFVKGNTVYLVKGKFDQYSTIEDFLHPFTASLREYNPTLFDNLFNESKSKLKEVYNFYKDNIGEKEAEIEVVNRAITDKLVSRSLLKRFFDFIKEVLKNIFPFSINNIQSSQINENFTVENIADLLLNGGYKFEHYYTQQPFYNANISQTQQKIFESLQNNAKNNDIYKIGEGYSKDVARTSDLVDALKRRLWPNLSKAIRENLSKKFNAEDGTNLHGVVEDIISRYVDKGTGFIKKVPSDKKNFHSIDEAIYNKIEKDYIVPLLESYPQGSRFLVETVLFDPDSGSIVKKYDNNGNEISSEYKKGLASTVDLIIITPDSKIHVYDWKFKDDKDVDKYLTKSSKKLYEVQLTSYVNTIKKITGVKDEDFEIVRIQPFIRVSKWDNIIKQPLLDDVIVPSINFEEIEYKKLFPYLSVKEYMKNAELGKFLDKIRNILNVYSKINILENEIENDFQFEKEIENAISDFQFLKQLESLMFIHENALSKITEYIKEFEKIDTIDPSQFKKVKDRIQAVKELLETISDFEFALEEVYGKELDISLAKTEEEKEQENKFKSKATSFIRAVKKIKGDFEKTQSDIYIKLAREEAGIENLAATEKKITFFKKLFTNLASPETRTAYYFGKIISDFWPKINLAIRNTRELLEETSYKIMKEQKGKSLQSVFDSMIDKKKGRLKSKIKKTFYEDRDEVIRNGDIKEIRKFFLNSYSNFEEIEKKFKNRLDQAIEDIQNSDYPESFKEKKIEQEKENWDLTSSPFAFRRINGKFNNSKWFIDNYHEDWYKEICKPQNTEVKKFHDLMMEMNEELVALNKIPQKYKFTFIPHIEKSMSQKPITQFFSHINRKMQVNSNTGLHGTVDPITGKPSNKIFLPFVDDIFNGDYSNKSFDLISSVGKMKEALEFYKAYSELESFAKTLLDIEENKSVYDVNMFGEIKKDNKYPDAKATPIKHKANFEYLKQFIDSTIYGKSVLEDFDKMISFTNKKTGEVTTYSGARTLQQLQTLQYLKDFALNFQSPIRIFFTGLIQSKLLNAKEFTSSDVSMINSVFVNKRFNKNSLNYKMLEFFSPLMNQRHKEKWDELSTNKSIKHLNKEKLTYGMELADIKLQYAIALALLENSVVINNKLVNARIYVKSLPKYQNIYANNANNPSKIKQIKKEMEDDIKELIKNNGIKHLSSIKDGKLFIRGISDIKDVEQRTKAENDAILYITNVTQHHAQKVTGMNPSWVKYGYKMYAFSKLFSTYRTWIPHFAAARFGNFKKNVQVDYQWGRHLAYFDTVSKSFSKSKLGVIKALFGLTSKEDLIEFAKLKYLQLKAKGEYENTIFGKEFIDEDEFIEMYIGNTDKTFKEFVFIMSMMIILMTGLLKAGDDDDETDKSLKKYAMYNIDKMTDDFTIFYSFGSMIEIIKSPVPLITYLTAVSRMFMSILKEPFDTEDKNMTIKNIGKALPITSEMMKILAVIFPELRKEYGIKQATTNSFIY